MNDVGTGMISGPSIMREFFYIAFEFEFIVVISDKDRRYSPDWYVYSIRF